MSGRTGRRTSRSQSSKTQSASLKYKISDKDVSTTVFFKDYVSDDDDLAAIKMIIENDEDTYTVYPNESMPKSAYKSVARQIFRTILNPEFLCKGLNSDYIKTSIQNMDAIVVIGTKDANIMPNGNIYGFALVFFDMVSNSIYVDVICSHVGIKGAGEALLKSLENIGKLLSISKIALKSVNSAIGFYEKYGFYKTGECEKNMLCEMERDLIRTRSRGSKQSNRGGKLNKTLNKRSPKNRRTQKKLV